MKNFKKMIACLLCAVLFLTACSNKNNLNNQAAEPTRESMDSIPEEYTLGSATRPWHKVRENWEPEVDKKSEFGLQEQVISSETPTFSYKGVELTMMPEFISQPMHLQVQPVKLPPPWEDAAINAYDFSIVDSSEDCGVIEIRIPYPKGDKASEEHVIGAGYFNEKTKQWEPIAFWLDEKNEQVVITTDHLSIYSSFKVIGERTRYARATPIFAGTVMPENFEYTDVLLEAINNGLNPGQKALDLGLEMNSLWLSSSDAVLSLQALAYNSEFLADLSNAFANVGSGLALVQLAADYNRGEPVALVGNALKNIGNFTISKLGNSVMSAAMVGVFAIDYSLNKLIKTTLEDRKNIWLNAYKMYYRENYHRSAPDWYKIMKRLEKKSANPEEFKKAVDKELDNYTNLFWNASEDVIAFYQSEAQASGFTGGGGLNEKLKSDISKEFKIDLMTGRLQVVFYRLQQEHMLRQRQEYGRAIENLAKQLNRVVTLTITEEFKGDKAKYAGYYVRFAPLSDEVDPKEWTGRLDKDGNMRATFTILGHMEAGAPNKILLFPDKETLENNEAALTIDFTMEVPETEIIIESRERLTKLVPRWATDQKLMGKIMQNEDSLYRSTAAFPFPIEHLLTQKPILIPENDIIDINLSGQWTAPTKEKTDEINNVTSKYSYNITNLSLKINLSKNEEFPVIGTDAKVLLLEGTGTYHYQVTVTTVDEGSSKMITPFGSDTETTITSKFTLISSGDVELYTDNKAIDSSKPVIQRKEGFENMETTGIVMKFKAHETSNNGVRYHSMSSINSNGEEKKESWTTDIEMSGLLPTDSPRWIYFKYPVD